MPHSELTIRITTQYLQFNDWRQNIPFKEAPDCAECAYYYITHDASFPYGCRALDFKSKRKPHQDVLDASNKLCLAFEPRRKAKA